MRKFFTAALALAAVLVSSVAFGQLSVDIPANADTTIYSSLPDNAGGAGTSLWVGNAGPSPRRILISFAVSGGYLPGGAQIAAATMYLYMTKVPGPGAPSVIGFSTLGLRRVTASWGEGAETGTGGGGVLGVFPSATWNQRFATSTGWGSAGSDNAGFDSGSWGEDATISEYKPFTGGQMASDVQGWFNSPATNNGWVILDASGTQFTARQFDSRNGGAPPILRVFYYKPLGAACGGAGECASGACPNGFCCNVGSCPAQSECQSSAPTCGPSGTCTNSNYVTGTPCSTDGNPCTIDSCNGSGSCVHLAGNAGAACPDDGNACTADTCNGSSPTCQHVPDLNGSGCIVSCTTDVDCPTGKYCNGGTCQARLGNGLACTVNDGCISGQCVDHVCCNVACSGQCEACDVAGALGTCTATTGPPHGTRAACVTDQSACGGTCNGVTRTACTYPTSACRAPSCSNGTGTLAATCSGGKCPAVRTATCAPYDCGVSACLTTCNQDVECVAGDYCGTNVCKPKVLAGQTCAADAQCLTGHCVDKVCCDQACGEECEACDVPGKEGTCSAVAGPPHGKRKLCADDKSGCGGKCDGKGVTACAYPGPGVECRAGTCSGGAAVLAASCDGTGNCPAVQKQSCKAFQCTPDGSKCDGDCTVDTDCNSTDFCAAGVCAPVLVNGSPCADGSQCSSSYCVDGVCCSSPCTGQCQACNLAGEEGACSPVTGAPHGIRAACTTDGTTCGGTCDGTSPNCTYPVATTLCRTGSCTGGVATAEASCQGTGSCPASLLEPCRPKACSGALCGGGCTTDATCSAGQFCAGGVCIAKLSQSQPCGKNSQCTNGQCVDGFCCDRACAGECEACDVIPFVGKCTTVKAGTVPHGGRVTCPGVGACGATCDGTNALGCKYPGGAVACGLSSCENGVQHGASVCNGAGSCQIAVANDCSPYVCETSSIDAPAACLTRCVTLSDCARGYLCLDGNCVVPAGGLPDAGPDAGPTADGGIPSRGDGGATGVGGVNGQGGTPGMGASSSSSGGEGFVDGGGTAPDGGATPKGSKDEGACGCRLSANTDEAPRSRGLVVWALALGLAARRRGRNRTRVVD